MSEAGARMGPYRLERLIGQGGIGEVWSAVRDGDGFRVAVKLLPRTEGDGETRLRRFETEAEVGSTIRHENLVRVLEHGRVGSRPYLVLELLEGASCAALLMPKAPLPLGLVAALAIQVVSGLRALHGARKDAPVLHRDIKPSNLFLTGEGVLKIIDFGIALIAQTGRTQTATADQVGSLPYSSPEQVRGERVDERTDLFSLGLVLHELLTGHRVLAQANAAGIVAELMWSPINPVSATRPEVPAGLDALVMGLLEKEPGHRPASAAVVLAALHRLPGPVPWTTTEIAAWMSALPSAAVSGLPRLSETQTRHVLAPVPRRGRFWFALAFLPLVAALVWTRLPSRLPAVAPSPALAAVPTPAAIPSAPTPSPARTSRPELHHPPRPAPAAKPKPSKPEPKLSSSYLSVDARPFYARIFVDGRDVGVTPLFRERLPSGPHQVEALREDGQRRRQTVTLSPEAAQTVVFTWP